MASGTIKTPGWKLLWTNPNPNNEFAPQTVSVDLSGYNEILLVYKLGTYWTRIGSLLITEFGNTYLLNESGYDGRISRREVSMSSNGATFGAASFYNTYAASSTNTDNKLKVPYRIYAR